MNYTIYIDRNKCQGAGACVAAAPEAFALDDQNKAVLVDPEAVGDDTIYGAAQMCPYDAITLFDEDGNQVYPRNLVLG